MAPNAEAAQYLVSHVRSFAPYSHVVVNVIPGLDEMLRFFCCLIGSSGMDGVVNATASLLHGVKHGSSGPGLVFRDGATAAVSLLRYVP